MIKSHKPPLWCEHCRSHYPEDHYDQEGYHKVGMAYGPEGGQLLAWRVLADIFRNCEDGSASVESILALIPADLRSALGQDQES